MDASQGSEVPMVNEVPVVFPKELTGMHLTETSSL
jgi:hypothetical protein